MAALTGPGETTAPIEIANANTNTVNREEVGIGLMQESTDEDFTLK
jgi:hypothetical protein